MRGFLSAKLPELATKAELISLRSETKAGMADLRRETKAGMADLRSETKAEFTDVRHEINGMCRSPWMPADLVPPGLTIPERGPGLCPGAGSGKAHRTSPAMTIGESSVSV
jgi:hypothetical protein